jgi:acyl-CoA thioesterase-1
VKRNFKPYRYHQLMALISKLFCVVVILCCTSCNKTEQSVQTKKIAVKDQVDNDEEDSKKVMLFFGNSLTAGYGVDPDDAIPYLIRKKLDSLSLPYRVINAGLSGETTASGVNRIDWVLREPVDIMILELGGNDGLRGIDPKETRKNLQEIIDIALTKYPDMKIIIAGMESPPNMGQQYTEEFRSVFRDLASENQLPLIPFLLAGVGGEPELNLDDGIHPNEQGHQIVMRNVWEVLEPLLAQIPKNK